MAVALGTPVSLFIKFIFERIEKVSVIIKTAAYLVSAVILVLYYLFLIPNFEMVPMTRYVAVSIAFYLAALLVPYYYKKDNFGFLKLASNLKPEELNRLYGTLIESNINKSSIIESIQNTIKDNSLSKEQRDKLGQLINGIK
jgi:hypothetical protein